ncbi:MAG: type VI secretion system lipoprotein TssJ [Rhizobiales bacterium]|nr:type VI secretion system lipoprotein TssJ [Hyphomicrobiales bacterium]
MGVMGFAARGGLLRAVPKGLSVAARFVFVCVLASSLTACGLFGKKDVPPPKEIEIKPAPAAASLDFVAVASPLANPGPDGVPAPVVMRLYQLNAETNFSNASFRQLWEEDAKTLGPTMLGKTEIYLTPGGIEHVKANLIEGTSIVAVVVGFRNFENAKWRAMVGLQGEKRFKLKADLKTLAVDLGPQD